MLRAAARRLVPAPAQADDLVQETWLRALRASVLPRDTRQLGSWLRTILRRAASDVRRQQARRDRREGAVAALEAPEAVGQLASPEGTWLEEAVETERLRAASTRAAALGAAIRSRSLEERRLLVLRFVENLRHREIGRRLGVTEAAARQAVSVLLRRLRAQLSTPGAERVRGREDE